MRADSTSTPLTGGSAGENKMRGSITTFSPPADSTGSWRTRSHETHSVFVRLGYRRVVGGCGHYRRPGSTVVSGLREGDGERSPGHLQVEPSPDRHRSLHVPAGLRWAEPG